MAKAINAEDFGGHIIDLGIAILNADYTSELIVCQRHLRQGIRDNFTSSIAPDGTPWPQRKDPGDGHPLLMESGDMLQAAVGSGPGGSSSVTGKELELKIDLNTIPYARAQDSGRPEINLPARHYFGASPETLDICEEELDRGVERILEEV